MPIKENKIYVIYTWLIAIALTLLNATYDLKASDALDFFVTYEPNRDLPYRITQDPTLLLQIIPQDRDRLLERITISQFITLFSKASCSILRGILKSYAQSVSTLTLANEPLSYDFLQQVSNLFTGIRHLIINQPIIREAALSIKLFFPQLTHLDISRNHVDEITINILRTLPRLETFSFTYKHADFTLEGWCLIKNWDIRSLYKH